MARKKLHRSDPNAKRPNQPAKHNGRALSKIVLIVGILLAVLVGFAAVAARRDTTAELTATGGRAAVPPPTPQYVANAPAKEYVYAGSKLLAVSEPVQPAPNDLGVWRLSTGTWYVLGDGGGTSQQSWGVSTDKPAPGDFDGDGKTDFCVFRPSDGNWYSIASSSGAMVTTGWGQNGDIPVPADFDGDSRTDFAVYRPTTQTWYVKHSGGAQAQISLQYGNSTDQPVPSDFDGDGKADFALWRNGDATWNVWQSSTNSATSLQFGASGDKAVPGDYDGDLKTDHAVWKSNDTWSIRQSSTGTTISLGTWGYQSSDIAVQGDYDSDGKTDRAVWRPSNGTWYIIKSSNLNWRVQQWGQSGDIPVPAPYRR
ncbi:MAG: VCBS repeat-containing protein [Acidobacteria bacterium]|nr:VCBS repeat-containing protein [Acidobacteriota bacterium]